MIMPTVPGVKSVKLRMSIISQEQQQESKILACKKSISVLFFHFCEQVGWMCVCTKNIFIPPLFVENPKKAEIVLFFTCLSSDNFVDSPLPSSTITPVLQ